MILGNGVMQAFRRARHRHDEHEIEEQLERRRDAMRFVRRAGSHHRGTVSSFHHEVHEVLVRRCWVLVDPLNRAPS